MQVSANWANFDGQTPFLRAALSGDITLMRLLLEHGADPNIKTNDGATPLMAAAGVNWVVARPSADPTRNIWKPRSCASSEATT